MLLDFHEKYSLNFGIENRHIFYDKKFVQCWLNTTPEIKNGESKGFLKDYIIQYNIPISKFPQSGFGRQNSQRPTGGQKKFYSRTIFLCENNE